MSKKIIGLIGEKCAGKGTVSNYLIKKYKATHYGTSKILRRTIEDLHLPLTRDNLIKLALVLKEGYGPTVIIDALIANIEQNKSNIIIADGIRMHGDVEPFKNKFGKNFYLLYITADIKKRYQRSKSRGEKVGEKEASFNDFLKEETRLTELSIHEIGKKADFIINNNGTEKELVNQLDIIMKKILKNS